MKAYKFLLYDKFEEPLNYDSFKEAQQAYLKAIKESTFYFECTTDIFELIKNVKRTTAHIGPYEDLTPFEALNRIGSDLVLLVGAEMLFKGYNGIKADSIKLNMSNKDGFDMAVKTTEKGIIYGEAFNAAASFCKQKFRNAVKKLEKESEGIILFNSDIGYILDNYTTKIEKETTTVFYRIECDITALKN